MKSINPPHVTTKTKQAESRVMQWLSSCRDVMHVVHNGIEHAYPPQFIDGLVTSQSRAAMEIRNTPDVIGQWITGDLFWCEIKSGGSVSRDSYEACMAMHRHCRPVMLCVWSSDGIYWQWIDRVRFQDSRDVVGRYSRPHPVDADGWIVPLRRRPGMSGQPHKRIAADSLLDGLHKQPRPVRTQ